MYLPPRRSRGPAQPRDRVPRLISAITVGAVAMGAACGLVSAASAQSRPDQAPSLTVDLAGDPYTAGDGIRGTDTRADPRDWSLAAPAWQARLSRLASDNTGLRRVDASIVVAFRVVTKDFFYERRIPDGRGGEVVLNAARRDRIRPDAQVVMVGLGGSDAQLARILAGPRPSSDTI